MATEGAHPKKVCSTGGG